MAPSGRSSAAPAGTPGARRWLRGLRAVVWWGAVAGPALAVSLLLTGLHAGPTRGTWAPVMPYARAIWFGEHRLVALDSVYRITEAGAPGTFPLSVTGLVLGAPITVGSWFFWQLAFLAAGAVALCWIVRRCWPRAGGPAVAAGAAALALGCAPVRSGMQLGTIDLVLLALMVAGLWPRRPSTPVPGLALGLAAAVGIGPITAALAAVAGGPRTPSAPMRRRGMIAMAVVVLLSGCAFLVAPWNGTDFWVMLFDGRLGGWPVIDPSLGARAGGAGWVIGAALLVLALGVAAWAWRHERSSLGVVAVCLALSIGVPGHWALAGLPALLAGLVALSSPRLPWRVATLAWAAWTCLLPIDLVQGKLAWITPMWGWGSAVGAGILVLLMTIECGRTLRMARPRVS
ncbi:glycosyltransferase family 87 protein [Propionibacterium sp.]|uniref:glycosyltransferase family 87 protein n=1 Tax=Propionibacterium sp. TaxID=1977903 RepID=UPI00345E4D40